MMSNAIRRALPLRDATKLDSTQYPALHASQCCLLASGFLQYAVFKRVAGDVG
jgi:hypothetical protein